MAKSGYQRPAAAADAAVALWISASPVLQLYARVKPVRAQHLGNLTWFKILFSTVHSESEFQM